MPNAITLVIESRIAMAVCNEIRIRVLASNRGDVPRFTCILIPHRSELRGRIKYRIVRPRCQLAFAAVPPERISSAELRDKGAEAWIGKDVNPRCR
ncbi:hypothetical protein D3C84_1020420 [compost metagenome]